MRCPFIAPSGQQCIADASKRHKAHLYAPQRTESHEAQDLANWLRGHGFLFLHVPNEGVRTPQQAARLRREGMQKGAPDFLIFTALHWKPLPRTCKGLAIELKRPGQKITVEQDKWLRALRESGWLTTVAYSAQEAADWVLQQTGI